MSTYTTLENRIWRSIPHCRTWRSLLHQEMNNRAERSPSHYFDTPYTLHFQNGYDGPSECIMDIVPQHPSSWYAYTNLYVYLPWWNKKGQPEVFSISQELWSKWITSPCFRSF